MNNPMNFPFLIFALSFLSLWLSVRIGVFIRQKRKDFNEEAHQDLDTVLAATLTLLGLIIGFSFSMAISRYDQRKNYEEEEANAIGTEYLRADLLPLSDGVKVKHLLSHYLDLRILFYTSRDVAQIRQINIETAQLQSELWPAVRDPALAKPSPMSALAVSGMNDVLNSQGYTQASWWNRIPFSAWGLMGAIAVFSNLLMGFDVRSARSNATLLLVLPLLVSISFFLIADIDSPRRGIIRVHPKNLVTLAESLRGH